MKHPAKIDIAVLILFFNRPDSLKKVFAEVRKARPSRLFLYQDGPRGERDMEGIMACREVVADIDWECDVRQMYQERNFGCDPSEYISQKWAFSLADKCIVLEDDDVPSQSFFPFCKEMLDRYEHDERIVMVSGFNSEERIEGCPYDYLFTSVMSIWGWASWRRVVDRWDGKYSFLDDEYDIGQAAAQDELRHAPGLLRPPRKRPRVLRDNTLGGDALRLGAGHSAYAQPHQQPRRDAGLHALCGQPGAHAAPPQAYVHHAALRA